MGSGPAWVLALLTPAPLIPDTAAQASPDRPWLLRTWRLEQQSRGLPALGTFPVPVGLHRGGSGLGMGLLAHGHHCPATTRRGMRAGQACLHTPSSEELVVTKMWGTSGCWLHPQGPQAGSHMAVLGEGAEPTLSQGDPPARWNHSNDFWLAPALTFSRRSCQLSHITSTRLCLWGHHPAPLLAPRCPRQRLSSNRPGYRSRGRSTAKDDGSVSVRTKGQGGRWSPAHLPPPPVPIPWLPCPQGGVGRVSLHWSLKVGP